MSWAPSGFRGRTQIVVQSGTLEAGCSVRIADNEPGWGEALDRYGVVRRLNIESDPMKALVETKTSKGWVPVDNLTIVRGDT